MLPDFGWTELLMIAIVLIVVVGPKDLPRVVRGFSKQMRSVRKMAGDFRKQFDDALSEAELDELKSLANDVKSIDPRNTIKDALNPLNEVGQELNDELKGIAKSIDSDDLPDPEIAPPPRELTPDEAYPQLAKMRQEQEAAHAATKKAAPKKPAARKTATKKPASKRAPAKSTVKKSATAKTTTTRKASAKKPAAKKTSSRKPATKAGGKA